MFNVDHDLGKLAGATVLCIGDVMLDDFVYGEVARISPEAPAPVIRVQRSDIIVGGAGNVARNIAALGASCLFVGVVGDDDAGRMLKSSLSSEARVEAMLVVDRARPTTRKVRFVSEHYSTHLLRADWETAAPVSGEVERGLIDNALKALPKADAVILSDYAKGVLTKNVIRAVIDAAVKAGKPVIVDPKGTDYGRYRGATLLTPNRKELHEATAMAVDSDDAVVAAARHLIDTCGVEAVLVTRSQDGMSLVTAAGAVHHLPAEAREVFDVSGAGDTVIATLAAAIASGADPLDAARIANVAAGIVVGKVGTAVAYGHEVIAGLHHDEILSAETKVRGATAAEDMVGRWHRKGYKVGFTNGCFDLLHPGHVSLLSQAKAACDRLVVGLNSDASVKRLKGPTRPVQTEASRATVLASLASVDMVVIFGEDTPLDLIRQLKPDVLVKGADYTVDTVVGAADVTGWGGQVVLAKLVDGQSTTNTIKKMSA